MQSYLHSIGVSVSSTNVVTDDHKSHLTVKANRSDKNLGIRRVRSEPRLTTRVRSKSRRRRRNRQQLKQCLERRTSFDTELTGPRSKHNATQPQRRESFEQKPATSNSLHFNATRPRRRASFDKPEEALQMTPLTPRDLDLFRRHNILQALGDLTSLKVDDANDGEIDRSSLSSSSSSSASSSSTSTRSMPTMPCYSERWNTTFTD